MNAVSGGYQARSAAVSSFCAKLLAVVFLVLKGCAKKRFWSTGASGRTGRRTYLLQLAMPVIITSDGNFPAEQ
eukprot:4789081-Pleurochrysis_carterae.AAC.3